MKKKSILTMAGEVKTPASKIMSAKELLDEMEIFTSKTSEKGTTSSGPSLGTSIRKKGDYTVINNKFYVKTGMFEMLKRNVNKGVNTLLTGPTGVGKTEIMTYIAKILGKDIYIFDMGTMSDPIMGLVGSHILTAEDGKVVSKFSMSRFAEAIQTPSIVLMDEINRASAQSNNLLFPCLDFRRELAMEYNFDNRSPIKIHPDCTFIATANVGAQYTGTHKLDKALQDRFMIMEMDPIDKDAMTDLLALEYPGISSAVRGKAISFYFELVKMHEDFSVSFNMSMRHMKIIMGLVADGFTLYDACYSVCKGIGGTAGIEALSSILNSLK